MLWKEGEKVETKKIVIIVSVPNFKPPLSFVSIGIDIRDGQLAAHSFMTTVNLSVFLGLFVLNLKSVHSSV